MNINLREEETQEYMALYINYLGDIQQLNKNMTNVFIEIIKRTKYDKLQHEISNIIDIYNKTVINGDLFEKRRNSKVCLKACLENYRAGENAYEVCIQIENQMEDIFKETLKIQNIDTIPTERPVITDEDIEKLKDICKKSQVDINDINNSYISNIESKCSDNDIYETLKPLIKEISLIMETFFETSLHSFEKLHEFLRETSVQLSNVSDENKFSNTNYTGVNGSDNINQSSNITNSDNSKNGNNISNMAAEQINDIEEYVNNVLIYARQCSDVNQTALDLENKDKEVLKKCIKKIALSPIELPSIPIKLPFIIDKAIPKLSIIAIGKIVDKPIDKIVYTLQKNKTYRSSNLKIKKPISKLKSKMMENANIEGYQPIYNQNSKLSDKNYRTIGFYYEQKYKFNILNQPYFKYEQKVYNHNLQILRNNPKIQDRYFYEIVSRHAGLSGEIIEVSFLSAVLYFKNKYGHIKWKNDESKALGLILNTYREALGVCVKKFDSLGIDDSVLDNWLNEFCEAFPNADLSIHPSDVDKI